MNYQQAAKMARKRTKRMGRVYRPVKCQNGKWLVCDLLVRQAG